MAPYVSRPLRTRTRVWIVGCTVLFAALAQAALIKMTIQDFHLPGTQVLEVTQEVIFSSQECAGCHGPWQPFNEPYSTWSGSLMALAGRDPLFYAQMTTANQDVGNVGYFCMRCHVPNSFPSGHAYQTDGSTIDDYDMDGVSCHFCHSMVDPIFKPGISPPEDETILQAMAEVPQYYGNAMFVLDPDGTRRGPRQDHQALHPVIVSPFHKTGDFCGTCHDVGNVAVSLQPDGTYRYNNIDEPTPDEDLWTQFPLERTYTEWKLSAFANGGVDMGGRFGGSGLTVMETCQDCHMPKTSGQSCFAAPVRDNLAQHDFAGAAVPSLDLIAEYYQDDPFVDQNAIAVGRAKALSMLERSASLELEQDCGSLRVRVFNETGHKLPTGHIEGRRVWLNVSFFDIGNTLLQVYGHYDEEEAQLDEQSTEIYEMHVGLSDDAAQATGYPVGLTTHMALADTIVKDNRIPPRGFDNEAFTAGGAPVVGTQYADGQYWDDTFFAIPSGAAQAEVTVNYQTLTRHYIEALRDGNVTDTWGDTLYDLWVATGKGAPIPIVSEAALLVGFERGDLTCDGAVNAFDLAVLLGAWADSDSPADLNGDWIVNAFDLALLLGNWG